MPWSTSLRLHWKPHALPPEMRGFFAHLFAQRTAESILMIATPVALYEYGAKLSFITRVFSSQPQAGLLSVLLFYILARLVSTALTRQLTMVFNWLGISHTMIVGQLLLLISFVLFPFIPHFPVLFLLAALLRGLGTFLYWTGHHSYFGSVAIPKQLGEEVGALEFLSNLARITAPLVAAFLIVRFGYLSAFLTGAAFSAAAAVLLLTIPNFHTKQQWHWSHLWTNLRRREYQEVALGMAGYAWEEIGINLLWPVFLFITFERITTVSYILSGATLVSLLLVYLSGVIFDSRHFSRRLQTWAGLAMGALWLPRALFFQLPFTLVLTEALDRLLAGVYGTMFTATLFSRARDRDIFMFYTNREVILSFTLIAGFVLAILLLAIHWSWTLVLLSFLAGAVLSLRLRRLESSEKKGATL